jgi:hypothetical protein
MAFTFVNSRSRIRFANPSQFPNACLQKLAVPGDENSVGAAFLQLIDRNSTVRKAALQLISRVSAPHSRQCISAALAMLQVIVNQTSCPHVSMNGMSWVKLVVRTRRVCDGTTRSMPPL